MFVCNFGPLNIMRTDLHFDVPAAPKTVPEVQESVSFWPTVWGVGGEGHRLPVVPLWCTGSAGQLKITQILEYSHCITMIKNDCI